ncbi:MAG TPA: LLM class flavin-dependent oxidoreductase, partial [Solirubrobacteraceae bacterium]|nr:LLM class flavin-dependent oxidoreductase [Solirubrobacteraceae bacterium]
EHAAYGFPYPELKIRMDRFAEQLEVIHGSWGPGPFTFKGEHYQLDALEALPKPVQRPHLPLIMGGSAGPRVAALAARFADEYNTVVVTADVARERRERIHAACEAAGREPIRFSVMTPVITGVTEDEVRARAAASAEFRGMPADALIKDPPSGWLIGTVDALAEQIRALAQAGVDRILCQHLPHTDLEMVEILGTELAPLVA